MKTKQELEKEFEELYNEKLTLDKVRQELQKRADKNPWKIDEKGDIVYYANGRQAYWIEKQQLNQNDWIDHLMEKTWVDMNEFMPVYIEALFMHGYSLEIKSKQ